jgi:hypothetical protein
LRMHESRINIKENAWEISCVRLFALIQMVEDLTWFTCMNITVETLHGFARMNISYALVTSGYETADCPPACDCQCSVNKILLYIPK